MAKKTRHATVRLNQRQKELFIDVVKYILGVVAAGAVLAIVLTAPNLIQILKPLLKHEKQRYSEEDFKKVISKIYKDRLVEIEEKGGKQYLKITHKGRSKFIEYNIDTISIQKQKWDGKWRIVIFDIPEKFRIARDVLRNKLDQIGFLKIQKSVWVCPYECENEISFIAATYQIERYVNYIVAEKIDSNEFLKKRFNL